MAQKSMFDMLSYCYYNTQMNDINNSVGSIIQFCDTSYSLSKGQPSVLMEYINDALLDDKCQNFFNIMFNCPDKTSRYYIGKMTSAIINKAFSIYQEA